MNVRSDAGISILVTGAGGQVGRELVRQAARVGIATIARDRGQLDITDQTAVNAALTADAPHVDAVVNLAAYNAVDAAETDPDSALRVNGNGVATLARACAVTGTPLLHVSTDYVFDGTLERPYRESDDVLPVNAYGRSKAAGEEALRRVLERHLIVRTAWVFGADGSNFVTTMLRLARRSDEVTVVDDEIGCPTGATSLATALLTLTARMAEPGFDAWGTYHCCGDPPTSRADFARAIFALARERGLPTAHVKDVTAAQFGAAAPRPHRTPLDCGRMRDVFGIPQSDWHGDLAKMLDIVARSLR